MTIRTQERGVSRKGTQLKRHFPFSTEQPSALCVPAQPHPLLGPRPSSAGHSGRRCNQGGLPSPPTHQARALSVPESERRRTQSRPPGGFWERMLLYVWIPAAASRRLPKGASPVHAGGPPCPVEDVNVPFVTKPFQK